MVSSIKQVANQLKISQPQVQKTLDLLQEGATVPFIARYRKIITGGLDEEQIEEINKKYKYVVELNQRRDVISKILKEQDLLTDKIKKALDLAETKQVLEIIYEPFKEHKKTKAAAAIKLGLEPLAEEIFTQSNPDFNPMREARRYVNDEVESIEFAVEQAKFIIAQWIAQDHKARSLVKDQIWNYGFIESSKNVDVLDEKETFKQYYDHREWVKKIPSHRVMALARGEKLKILNLKFDFNIKKIRYDLSQHFFKIRTTGKIIFAALEDALTRLLIPSVKREIWNQLFDQAQNKSIDLFAQNLEQMLLAPAIKNKYVLAIDPAFASGCKLAVLSPIGQVLEVGLIKPHEPFKYTKKAAWTINHLIDEFGIDVIVIGNGTASRETEFFIARLMRRRQDKIPFSIVSEVGASVYSASKIAIDEFPDLSVEQRSAIHIGRKFQDPLNELVKIDPKSIGVGQYQHDVDQKKLSEHLTFKVNKVVNQVGVDLNTATVAILTYISGLSKNVAQGIVDFRKNDGKFTDRNELKKVKGLGPKSFEQSVGFLRILDSSNLFDRTMIHPESYELAQKIVDYLNIDLENINNEILTTANAEELADKLSSNIFDVQLILDALLAPGKDIRDEQDLPLLKTDMLTIDDLKLGSVVEGTVQNITDFGAFIYIGLKESALVHISKLSNTFVKHPSEVVSTGQRVKVEIIEVEKERGRIQAKLIS